LHQSTWTPKMLYADRSLEDEQLLVRPLMRELKKFEHGGRLKFKIHVLFHGEKLQPLHLVKSSFVH
jgi:hypothetical protein